MKIQVKILIAVLSVVILSISIVSFISIQLSINTLLERSTENAIQKGYNFANEINSNIVTYERIIQNLAVSSDIAIDIGDLLIKEQQIYPEFKELYYTNRKGNILEVTPYKSEAFEFPFTEKEYWKSTLGKSNYITKHWKELFKKWGDMYKIHSIAKLTNTSEVNSDFGYPAIVITTPVFKFYGQDTRPDVLGFISAVMPIKELFRRYWENIDKDGDKQLIIIDSKGNIIFHEDVNNLGKKLSDLDDSDILTKIETHMINQDSGIAFFSLNNTNAFLSFAPIAKEKWSIGVGGSTHIFMKDIRRIILFIIIATIISIISTFAIIFVITNKVTQPILKLNKISDSLKDGDLTQEITLQSKDEVGQLGKAFNEFIASLNTMIKHIKEVTRLTKEISSDLASSSETSATTVEEMTSTFEHVKNKTEILDKEINLSKNATKDVAGFVSDVIKLITNQANAITESSASIISMSTTIQQIASTSEEKLEVVNEFSKNASNGEVEMEKTTETILRVVDSANIMVDMIEIINNIAKKTNLLAMNASIEAAHAGSAGKGFAVVAGEIRKLAEDSSKNAKEISNSLKELVEEIHSSEESVVKTGKIFHSIVKSIKDVSLSMIDMKETLEEISLSSRGVTRSLEHIIEMTEDVKSSSDNLYDRISEINSSMDSVSSISDDVKQGMEESISGISDFNNTIENIAESGRQNNEKTSELEKLISIFKIKGENDEISPKMLDSNSSEGREHSKE